MFPHRALECLDIPWGIIRVKQHLPLASLHLLVAGSEEIPRRPVDEPDTPIRIGHPHDRRAAVRHDAKTVFTLAYCSRRPAALRDVLHPSHKVCRAAAGTFYQRDPYARPNRTPTAMDVPQLRVYESGWIPP